MFPSLIYATSADCPVDALVVGTCVGVALRAGAALRVGVAVGDGGVGGGFAGVVVGAGLGAQAGTSRNAIRTSPIVPYQDFTELNLSACMATSYCGHKS
jgi:hypothetical protein